MREGPARLAAVLAVLAVAAILVVVVALTSPPAPVQPGLPIDGRGTPPPGEAARVLRVVDGDTLVVEVGGERERVRHIGIDAPELARDDGTPVECWGEEGAAVHRELADGVDLHLARDVTDRDRFGRLLRHAWIALDGTWTHLGEELVRRGAARARSYPPDTARDDALAAAEHAARSRATGLWSDC